MSSILMISWCQHTNARMSDTSTEHTKRRITYSHGGKITFTIANKHVHLQNN